ncbi:hypothetical protein ABZ588_30940 [Streptomyces althioticus]|uniref:hypothetical protein n=1 Tax=Streptomyces althioticus TaxID=83380 RepID=UPI0034079E88
MPEIPESFRAGVHGDPVIDVDQLVRITSLHRGFLYQYLYAACLLRFMTADMTGCWWNAMRTSKQSSPNATCTCR